MVRQSDCSGHKVKTIIDKELHDITDLTLDPIKHMVYWVDMVNSVIERANYDGSKRTTLVYTSVRKLFRFDNILAIFVLN